MPVPEGSAKTVTNTGVSFLFRTRLSRRCFHVFSRKGKSLSVEKPEYKAVSKRIEIGNKKRF